MTDINDTANTTSEYLDEDVCRDEQKATPVYIGTISTMFVLCMYFLVSLLLALKRVPVASPEANCTLRYATILRSLLVAVIVTINIRLLLDIIQLSMGKELHNSFGVIFVTKAVLATLNSTCVYAFLWLRQWILYDQPTLKKVKTTSFKVFNIFVLILVVSLVAAGPVVETRYVMLKLSDDGCMLVRTNKWTFALAVYTAFSIFYQLILLGFFLYPLLQTHVSSDETTPVAPIVKRSAFSASACFVDEITFVIVHSLVLRPLMLNTVTTDLKMIVYYICLVASYNDWKEKFCFLCFGKRSVMRTSSRIATSFRSKLSSDDLEAKTLRHERHNRSMKT